MISILFIFTQVLFNENKAIESQLKSFLDKRLSNFVRYEFEIADLPKNYNKLELDNDREFKINKNYAFVPVIVYDKRKNISLSVITLKIKLYQKVLIALKDINRNELLSNYLFEEKIVNISNLRGNPVTNIDFDQGYRAKSSIKIGSVLIEEYIEKNPDVFFNDKLILHAGGNGVDISTEVIAKEEGRIGEIIRVITSDNKIFKARIIDKYNVSLIE